MMDILVVVYCHFKSRIHVSTVAELVKDMGVGVDVSEFESPMLKNKKSSVHHVSLFLYTQSCIGSDIVFSVPFLFLCLGFCAIIIVPCIQCTSVPSDFFCF